jgi:PTH1 family peptidyl-tRNA hydrolase
VLRKSSGGQVADQGSLRVEDGQMWLIVGLGNPGRQYARTRHNIGFMVLERLAERWALPMSSKKFSARVAQGVFGGHRVALAQPQTFMNCSGDSVQPMAAYLKVPVTQVVVVHDELDLPFGVVRIKASGGHAGHNGLRSIGKRLGESNYPRLRIGIGRPASGGDVTGYVLGAFSKGEKPHLDVVADRACDAIEAILDGGVVDAMNAMNGLDPLAL